MMREFGSHNRTDCQAALAKLSLTGTVSEFKSQFNKLSRRAGGFSDDLLLACFVGGLKEDIRVDVRALRPATLYRAYELAKVFEERHKENSNNRLFLLRQQSFQSSLAQSQQRTVTATPSISRGMGFQSNNPVSRTPASPNNRERKWSQAEYHDRRA